MIINLKVGHFIFAFALKTTLSSRHSIASLGVGHAPARATTEALSVKYPLLLRMKSRVAEVFAATTVHVAQR